MLHRAVGHFSVLQMNARMLGVKQFHLHGGPFESLKGAFFYSTRRRNIQFCESLFLFWYPSAGTSFHFHLLFLRIWSPKLDPFLSSDS